MIYLVGLGNPGEKYEKTRHNVGRDSVIAFSEVMGFSNFRLDKKTRSLQSQGVVGGREVTCIIPETYMNESGASVAPYKGSDFIVVQDEIELGIGTLKIVSNKGDGGHNGIKSLIKVLKTKDFTRVKIGVAKHKIFGEGIKKPQGRTRVVRHVLGKFGTFEQKTVQESIDRSVKIITSIITDGANSAMNRHNNV